MSRRDGPGTGAAAPAAVAAWLLALLANLVLAVPGLAAESAAERWRRIENMSPTEKSELLRQKQSFSSLSPDEQNRLRQLDQEVENDPNGDELRQVMRAYTEWLDTLPAYEQAKLADLPPAERIARIKQLRGDDGSWRPSSEDLETVGRWLREYAADPQHQAEIIAAASEQQRKELLDSQPIQRDWLAMRILWGEAFKTRDLEWRGWPDRPAWLTDGELASLRKQFSPPTRRQLQKTTPDLQWEKIRSWFEEPLPTGFLGGGFRSGPPSPPEELQEQLYAFFERLPEEEKDRLLNLPGDELQRQLREMYVGSLWPTMGGWRDGGMSSGGHDGRGGGQGRPDSRGDSRPWPDASADPPGSRRPLGGTTVPPGPPR